MPSQITKNVRVEKKSPQKPSVIILCSDKEISLTVERALSELEVSVVSNGDLTRKSFCNSDIVERAFSDLEVSVVSNDGLAMESIYDTDISVVIIDWRFLENLDYSGFRSLFPDAEVILILEKPFNELDFDAAASIYSGLKPSLTPHIPIDKLVLQDAVKYFLEKPAILEYLKRSYQ